MLEAVKACCERWGIDKVNVDDIARQSGVSRATLYRIFPGGRDVIFEAHRVYELDRFFTTLLGHIEGATSLEELLVSTVTCATRELRDDDHLALMLASEPGAVLGELTVDGLPRIIRVATAYLTPFADEFLPRPQSRALIDIVARLVISYFLAPIGRRRLRRRGVGPLLPAAVPPRPADDPTVISTVIPTSVPAPARHRSPGASIMSIAEQRAEHAGNETIIGRADLDDLEAILAISNTDANEVEHSVKDNADAVFTWDYSLQRPQLRKLYEKAKVGQWNATTDLDWSIEVDLEKVVSGDQVGIAAGIDPNLYDDTVIGHWGEKEWLAFGIQNRKWTLSQFLHGEQGALLCTAKITETVPWYDAKLYAATQVVDEARHVEVFARYLDEKMGGGYQVNAHLRMLLDDIINDSRWDMTYLGMQVMVEGLALAAFGFMHQMTEEPLLKKLLRYVMSDEARHVAFGVLSLKEVYDGMTDVEMKDRQEFAYEAAVRMRDRFLSQEVWEQMGVAPRRVADRVARPDARRVPADAVLQDRAELQEARPARPQRHVAAAPLRGDGRHPVRGLGRHHRGARQVRTGRRRGVIAPGRASVPGTDARPCNTSSIQVGSCAWQQQRPTGIPSSTASSRPNGSCRSGSSSTSSSPARSAEWPTSDAATAR